MKTEILNNPFLIGTIVNTHGIKGEVRLVSLSKWSNLYSEGKKIYYLEGNSFNELIITSSRDHKNFKLLTFNNINDINKIEWIKGHEIYVDYSSSGEENIIGFEVFDTNNEKMGIVEEILDQRVYESLILKVDGNKINIPYIENFIEKIDFNENTISISVEKNFFKVE